MKPGPRRGAPRLQELERQNQELLRTVQLLEEARGHYADHYDFAPYGCVTLDARGCVRELNVTAARLLGRDRAQIVGMPFFPFVERTHLQAFLTHLRRCTLFPEKCVTEIELATKRRARTIVELVSVPIVDTHTGHTVHRTALLDVTALRTLQRQVLDISEREQARIGHDLHDGPCQALIGIAMMAEAVARDLDTSHLEISARIRDLSRLVRESAGEVRLLASGLFPVKIEHYGLAWALRELAAETARRAAVRCTFRMDVPVVVTDHAAAVHLYRIAQEAVSNAVRHARPAEITVELAGSGGTVTLTIRDDGVGLADRSPEAGLGMHTMRYRANMLGGAITIAAAEPRGTAVTCSFPGKEVAHVEPMWRRQARGNRADGLPAT